MKSVRLTTTWITTEIWCREPDSNRHEPCGPRDFKSRVSTKFHHPGIERFNNLPPQTRQPNRTGSCPPHFLNACRIPPLLSIRSKPSSVAV